MVDGIELFNIKLNIHVHCVAAAMYIAARRNPRNAIQVIMYIALRGLRRPRNAMYIALAQTKRFYATPNFVI